MMVGMWDPVTGPEHSVPSPEITLNVFKKKMKVSVRERRWYKKSQKEPAGVEKKSRNTTMS